MTKTIRVRVASNSAYMGDDDTFGLPPFGSPCRAIADCKRIVDDYLKSAYEPGMSAEALCRSYTMFGDDPYIISDNEGVPFSAWEFMKMRVPTMAGQLQSAVEESNARLWISGTHGYGNSSGDHPGTEGAQWEGLGPDRGERALRRTAVRRTYGMILGCRWNYTVQVVR